MAYSFATLDILSIKTSLKFTVNPSWGMLSAVSLNLEPRLGALP
jgi:hypothetical protein